jgi:hypothetical protein
MRNKHFILTFFLLAGIILFAACNKDDDSTPTTTNFSGTLSGANETPPNASAATGTVSFTYNSSTKVLSGTVTYSGVVATAAHIHNGAVGVAGAVVFPLDAVSLASPISFTSVPLDASQEADLMNNLYYVNIHSAAYPGGEIRAQLTKQ